MATDGGPAFPRGYHRDGNSADHGGMTLRDYFAAKAMPAVITAYVEANGRCIGTDHVLNNCSIIAGKFADAMLFERERGK